MRQFDLSVIILGYNQRDKVLRLLRSIENQKLPDGIKFEVIYTDDGSSDGSVEALKKSQFAFPQRIADGWQQHDGRAATRNRAAQIANGLWLLFLDGDGEINEDFIGELWSAKQSGAVRQAALCVHAEAYCSARRYEVLRSPAYRYGERPVKAWLLQSGCFLIERELFFKFGKFNENLRGRSGEDVDFGARLASANIELRSVPSAKFYHNHQRTVAELIEVKRKYAAQGLPQMLTHSPELFRATRLSWLYDVKPPYASKGWKRIAKWLTFHVPVRFLTSIAEKNSNFWWCGRTIIPLLAFYGTMRGFHDYLILGKIGEEDA